MLETILGFKALIVAVLVGGAYLLWRRDYKKKQQPEPETVYVCQVCDEHDCVCEAQALGESGKDSEDIPGKNGH